MVADRRVQVLLAALFVLGVLLAALVGLSHLRRHLPSPATSEPAAVSTVSAPPAVAPSPVAAPIPVPAVSTPYPETVEKPELEEIRVAIESALIRNGVQLRQLEVKPQGNLILFRVQGEFPGDEWVGDLTRRLHSISSAIRVQSDPAQKMIGVAWEGNRPFLLRFYPPPVPLPKPVLAKKKVAIIMDDLGRDRQYARQLAKLPLAVTFSILPYEAHAGWTARLAHRSGREVLVHIPMQPRNYPDANPGEGALLVDLPAEELVARLRDHLERVPHAVGGNNHMGSLFVEDGAKMEVVLDVLQRRDLFFVDSLTTPKSTGYMTAKRLKMPVAVRDVFLDNVQDVDRIGRQIHHLIALAEKKGTAVGICHPYPETLEALRRSVPLFKKKGVDVVAVSRLLER
ncbi:MAG: hypothetical protein GXY54_03800 [Deltaproteobacteria bacterium]|nr:hypothetical protein [Deltaproteobacteria bacterium]